MRSQSDKTRHIARGKILVMTIIFIPILFGASALAVDLGAMWAIQAKMRTIADAASLAGAESFLQGGSNDEAKTAATTIATANAYAGSGQSSTVTVNIPPADPSAFVGQTGCVQTVVQFNQPAMFSVMWGTQTLPLTVRAVARSAATPYSSAAILLLAPGGTSMTLSGTTQVVAVNGSVVVDSTSASSIISSGSSSITTPALDLAGGMHYSGQNPDKATLTNYSQANTPDPLANLPPPSSSGMTTQSNSAINLTGSASRTLNPGIYNGGISMSGSSSVTLNPGIYYMNGGGISMSGTSSITGNGVLIYNTGGGSINMSGTGNITLSPMTSGAYAGTTIFQDRSDSASASMSGGSNINNSGTFYLPNAELTLSGTSGVATFGSQFITRTLAFSGSGGINVNYSTGAVASRTSISLVE
jgi:Flp pilus assembly protein TadG